MQKKYTLKFPNRLKSEVSKGEQSFFKSVIILTIGIVLVKIIGFLFKIPLEHIISKAGMGYFSTAYTIYQPVYTLAATGFASALSRLVATNYARNEIDEVFKIRVTARRLFFVTGIIGFVLMVIGSYVYINLVDSFSIYSMLAMSPSIFLCSLMASYRGYYEGTRNMYPTAISQVVEALGKLLFGLSFAIVIQRIAISQFNSQMGAYRTVFGVNCLSEEEALFVSYRFSAAGALAGITIGSAVALLYLFIQDKKDMSVSVCDVKVLKSDYTRISKEIIRIGFPIALGALVLTLTQLIDTSTIQVRLNSLDLDKLRIDYESYLVDVNDNSSIANALYGAYSSAITLYNLIPYITQAIGIGALPSVAAAWATNNLIEVRKRINSVVNIVVLIGMPCGLGIFALSEPIMQLLYTESTSGIASPMLQTLGIMVIFGTLVTPVCNLLQAVGKQTVPLKLMLIGAMIKLLLNYILVGVQEINIKGAPYGSLCCYVFIVLAGLFVLVRETNLKLDYKQTFVKPLVASSVCAVSAFLIHRLITVFLNIPKIATLVSIVIAVLVYVAMIFATRILKQEDVELLPKSEKIMRILTKLGYFK